MSTPKIFPKRYWANDNYGWADIPEPAREIWMRIKSPSLTWYAVDYEIIDANQIKLFVYDMADSVYGGIGKKIYETVVTEFTDSERAELNKRIENLKWAAAEAELERRAEKVRQQQIFAIRNELFGAKNA